MMGYSPIAEKSPIDQMGKNKWEKLMVFFPPLDQFILMVQITIICCFIMGQIYEEN